MNCLIISHVMIPSVLLCGHYQLSYLNDEKKLSYYFKDAQNVRSKDIDWADIVIFVRGDTNIEYIISKRLKNKKHLVYVLDDDLINIPDGFSCSRMYQYPRIHNNMINIIKNCNTFLTTSPVLLEKYGSWCKNSFLINEPSINQCENKVDNEKVKIGFAGSIDRTQDVNTILSDVVEKLIDKYKDKIEIEFMGARPDLVDKYNLKHIPYQDGYENYVRIMGQANWDIGLAPMPITAFHECKYFNKYVEYASFGMVGVYTNCKPYIFGIKDGYNGLLVNNNSDEWIKAISKLIDDDKLRKEMSNNCIHEAKEIYSLEKCSIDYYEKITFNYFKKDDIKVKLYLYDYIKCFILLIIYKIYEQGSKFPKWIFNRFIHYSKLTLSKIFKW